MENSTKSNNGIINMLVLLLLGQTRGGKTTKVASLSSIPWIISMVCGKIDGTTPVTTNWRFSQKNNNPELKLSSIEFKSKLISASTHSAEAYNAELEKHKLLVELFNFKKIEVESDETLEEIVNHHIDEFITNSSMETIVSLMNCKDLNSIVTRITIDVPPSEEFQKIIKENGLDEIIIRDTKGMGDISSSEEIDAIKQASIYDLGLDGIDGVLLLSLGSFVFPKQNEWYTNVYRLALNALPVFLETRNALVRPVYDRYRSTNCEATISDYLDGIHKNEYFKDLEITDFQHALKLLEKFEAAKQENGTWKFTSSWFSLSDCEFVTPVSTTCALLTNTAPTENIFINEDYAFFTAVNLHNISRIISRIMQVKKLHNMINNSGYIDAEFLSHASNTLQTMMNNGSKVSMYPEYRVITRDDVNTDIITTKEYLGPFNGITTLCRNKPRYLAAVTLATTSHVQLYWLIKSFPTLVSKLKDTNGNEIASEISLEKQNQLVRTYLNNRLLQSTDKYAYFRDYIITDRRIVVDAIKLCHANNTFQACPDALSRATLEVIRKIF